MSALIAFLSLPVIQVEEVRYSMDCHQPQMAKLPANDSQSQVFAGDFDTDDCSFVKKPSVHPSPKLNNFNLL